MLRHYAHQSGRPPITLNYGFTPSMVRPSAVAIVLMRGCPSTCTSAAHPA